MSQQKVPKYAAGLEIPRCEYRRADKLKLGDWIIANYAGAPMLMAVINLEKTETAIFLELATYPNRTCRYPWRTSIIRMPGELVSVHAGSVK